MNCNTDLSPISPASPLTSFVCSRIRSGIPDCSCSSCRLRCLQFVTVMLTFLKKIGQYSAECPSVEFLWCFLMIVSHPIHMTSLVMFILIIGVARFLHSRVTTERAILKIYSFTIEAQYKQHLNKCSVNNLYWQSYKLLSRY